MPLGVANRQVTVIVEMAGDPVTVRDASQPMTDSQKQQARDSLKAQQRQAEQQIRSLGGVVLADYQSAYNGIKVSISANRVPALHGVQNAVAVHPVQVFTPDNVHGVPLIGAPTVWGGAPGFAGEGMKIGIIDTGIDYTHADFGGPATPAAYQAALASDAQPADPTLFGPNAPRVKGGIDLVGDRYDASSMDPALTVPHPDPNPLDCFGHGTHVAGTAAGSGVLLDGTTFHGPYDASTVASHRWRVGPGVAPKADIYSIKVFGCSGSTNEVVDAIEWAVSNRMDVINMSLGSDLGSADNPDAKAAANAAKDGVIVVASAGNSGATPYLTGSPASGNGVISVAASDPTASLPGANLALNTGGTVQAIDANGVPLAGLGTLPVVVLRDHSGGISLGCNESEYHDAVITGKLVVTRRGTCARVTRAIFGQKHGAAAVLMVNNASGFPPFEGKIIAAPGTPVTIPFLGLPEPDGAAVATASAATLSDTTIANPGYLTLASFTSGGPRTGDSALKPDVTAPGVGIASAGMGSGTEAVVASGTSMASPHTAGAAVLVRQAHPAWRSVASWDAALINTADPGLVNGYSTRVAGAGLIQVQKAAATQVVALAGDGSATLNFGYQELDRDFSQHQDVKLHNFGPSPVDFTVSDSRDAGSPHSIALKRTTVTVPARGDASVQVELDVPAATAGDSTAFNDVAGLVTFTPTAGSNAGVTLRMPYYLVPRTVSDISTHLDTGALTRNGSTVATTVNRSRVGTGTADWYAWGLTDGMGAEAKGESNDLRAVGVQSFPGGVVFAISTQTRWSNPSANEFDILVSVNGDGIDNFDVVGIDLGLLTTGSFSGQMATAVIDLSTGLASIAFLADAPFNSTTLLLPVLPDQLGLPDSCPSPSNPRFTYHAVSFNLLDGSMDTAAGHAKFNACNPAISTGMFDLLSPGSSAAETVSVNSTEWALTPPLGLMIVSHDNRSNDEAQLIHVASR